MTENVGEKGSSWEGHKDDQTAELGMSIGHEKKGHSEKKKRRKNS